MKIFKRRIKIVIHCYAAVLLMLSAALTGCVGRETEFLTEISETEESDAVEEQETENSEMNTGFQEEPVEVYVDVCGAVAAPGVYKLEEGSRVFHAIEAAGGYLPEAAQGYVNQAGILGDGQQIFVPTEEELADTSSPWNPAGSNAVTRGNTSPGDSRVNINLAGEDELMTLTGIGASRARAIISYREANGPFSSIEDIMKVEGIKEGTFAKIKDEIIVG